MQDYVDKLGAEIEIVAQATKLYAPNINARKALFAIKTSERVFDKLSKNVLQNVMAFFDYKGTDFMKMRSINRKTKNSYMQEL